MQPLHHQLTKTCEKYKIPGMALVITQHGKPLFEHYHGFRDHREQHPINKNTIFGVASITKSLTTMAIMQLQDAGKLTVHDQVISWIPQLQWPDAPKANQLKIHHLMNHTSGLPGLPLVHQARRSSILQDPDGTYLFGKLPPQNTPVIHSPDDVIAAIGTTDMTLLGAPGDVFNYSNEGYALLQKIIEEASGMPFIEYVTSNIFTAIGMEDACLLTEDLTNKSNVTTLYAYTHDQQKVFHSPAWWDVGTIYANGSLKCSAADLTRYMEVFRQGGCISGKRIISEAAVKAMTTSSINLPNGGAYGYGMETGTLNELSHFGHGGSIKGVSAHFKVFKAINLTACILTNIADVPAEAILLDSVQKLLGIPDDTTQVKKHPLPEAALDKFSGTYYSEEGYEVQVTANEKTLILKNENITLTPVSACDFITEDGARYHFIIKDNKVSAICMGKRVLQRIQN